MAQFVNINGAAKLRLPTLVFIVGQKCNLKCKHCANFTPLLHQSYFNFDELKRDLEKMARVSHVGILQLQGGEPVDSPFLAELIDFITALRFADTLQIATNAVKPLLDVQIAAIKRSDVIVRISNYNVVSKSVARMVEQCTKNNIRHSVYQFAYRNGEWLDLGGIETPEVSAIEGQINFLSCPFKTCLTLENGLLARCSRGTTAHIAQNFVTRPTDHLYVRGIDDIVELGGRLFDYTENVQSMRACTFCRGGRTGMVEAGAQFTRAEVLELQTQMNAAAGATN